MIRETLLWLFVAGLVGYAWKDWYKSLCGLIALMAVYQHPDFPTSLAGIQGMNPWNVLLFSVMLAWVRARKIEGLKWDLSGKFTTYLAIFLFVIVLSFIRLTGHTEGQEELAMLRNADPPTVFSLGSEYIINCIKWLIPALMLYDGCRSEKRFRMAVWCILAIYVLIGVQVIRWMPFEHLTGGEDLSERALKILSREVGYHRVNLSMMLGGASWALFCAREIVPSKLGRMGLYFLFVLTFFGMALTGGRMGYVTWGVIGLMLAFFKWRRIFLYAPAVLVAVVLFLPSVRDRFMEGFTPDSIDTNTNIAQTEHVDVTEPNLYTITSGRTFIWPFVIDKIRKQPWMGYGRDAMVSTGLALYISAEYGEAFQHPHNMYLQWVMDNGILGSIPVFLLFFYIWMMAKDLFISKNDPIAVTIGGITLALVTSLLIAGMGSQTFYPREGSVGMWCSIGLALRVYTQHRLLSKSRASMPADDSVDADVNLWGDTGPPPRPVRWPKGVPQT